MNGFRFVVVRVPGTLGCIVVDTADPFGAGTGDMFPVPPCDRVDANHLAAVLNRWNAKGAIG